MSKYTPGPWKLFKFGTTGYTWCIDDSQDEAVAYIESATAVLHEGESKANARLIATAPELFEVLDEILDQLHDTALEPELWQKAIAVYKKAKGE